MVGRKIGARRLQMFEATFWLANAAARSSGWVWAGGRAVTGIV
jgi:hypothetical protein